MHNAMQQGQQWCNTPNMQQHVNHILNRLKSKWTDLSHAQISGQHDEIKAPKHNACMHANWLTN